MQGMTDAYLRKNQTGEPARSGGEFGSHKRPEGVSLTAAGTAVHAALESAALARDAGAMERINEEATTRRSFWDDPEFQKGLLEDIRTEIADRAHEGRDQPDVMKSLYAKRAELVQKLKAAGHEVPRP